MKMKTDVGTVHSSCASDIVECTAHAANTFHGLWILVIEQINKLQISKFMYRLTQDLLPSASLGCVSSMSNVHAYHTGALKNVCGSAARTNTDCLQLNVPRPIYFGITYLQIFIIAVVVFCLKNLIFACMIRASGLFMRFCIIC